MIEPESVYLEVRAMSTPLVVASASSPSLLFSSLLFSSLRFLQREILDFADAKPRINNGRMEW